MKRGIEAMSANGTGQQEVVSKEDAGRQGPISRYWSFFEWKRGIEAISPIWL
jgi:hypothetical protein